RLPGLVQVPRRPFEPAVLERHRDGAVCTATTSRHGNLGDGAPGQQGQADQSHASHCHSPKVLQACTLPFSLVVMSSAQLTRLAAPWWHGADEARIGPWAFHATSGRWKS